MKNGIHLHTLIRLTILSFSATITEELAQKSKKKKKKKEKRYDFGSGTFVL